jgi:uncharacterized protein YoxC
MNEQNIDQTDNVIGQYYTEIIFAVAIIIITIVVAISLQKTTRLPAKPISKTSSIIDALYDNISIKTNTEDISKKSKISVYNIEECNADQNYDHLLNTRKRSKSI